MNIKKILYIIFGCISFGLGAVGAVLPVLPTFPFLIFAAFCFARSSKKLDKWFKGTKLYKNNLETYAKGQGMTRKTKVRIMITVTFLMSFGFFIMFRKNLYIPCSILFGVWLFHILYFTFCIKKEEDVRQAERSPADFILLDSGAGTGRTFEWEWIKHMERPYFLAGGIHIDNVEKALEQLKPYAIDVSSGIETEGRKDKRKMAAIMTAVRKERKL